MSNKQLYIPLESVINDYIIESEQSNNKFFKLFHLAFRCMDDLGMDFFYSIKSVILTVNANKTITLPNDYLQYTKFGIKNGRGEIIPLRYNEKITTFNDQREERLADIAAINALNLSSDGLPTFYNYWNGSGYENMLGASVGGGYAGFKIDSENGVILLDANFGYSEAILEYTASPDPTTEYQIPLVFREAIVAWLAWTDIRNIPSTRRGNLGDKRDKRKEYYEQRRLAIKKYRPFYLDQAYKASQDSVRLTMKG